MTEKTPVFCTVFMRTIWLWPYFNHRVTSEPGISHVKFKRFSIVERLYMLRMFIKLFNFLQVADNCRGKYWTKKEIFELIVPFICHIKFSFPNTPFTWPWNLVRYKVQWQCSPQSRLILEHYQYNKRIRNADTSLSCHWQTVVIYFDFEKDVRISCILF